jgi:hypothetical protein
LANTNNQSCIGVVYGCTDITALNFVSAANTNDGSCIEIIEGCMDYNAVNFNPQATVALYTCTYLLGGCTIETYTEFNPLADFSDGSCYQLKVIGCTNDLFLEFNHLANINDESCETIKFPGCTSVIANNYNPSANYSDGSCEFEAFISEYNQALDSVQILTTIIESGVADPIYSDLQFGWNMIGFTLNQPMNVVEAFDPIVNDTDITAEYPIHLDKNVNGQFWSPEFSINMLGNLTPGLGYMIYLNQPIPNFSFSD